MWRLLATADSTRCVRVLHWRLCVFFFLLFFFVLRIRRPPRSTLDRSSAASDVYKRQDRDWNIAGVVQDGDQVLSTVSIGLLNGKQGKADLSSSIFHIDQRLSLIHI